MTTIAIVAQKDFNNSNKPALMLTIALGKLVYKVTEDDFNRLVVLKNQITLLEKREQRDENYDDETWNKLQERYQELYTAVAKRSELVCQFQEQVFL